LLREPYRFNFFQAVRLLERLLCERARGDLAGQRYAVGLDKPPEREIVRFRSLPALSFPTSAVSQIRQPLRDSGSSTDSLPLEMTVAFLGLTGPSGILPYHYTTLLLQRLRDKDFSLRDFLDLFNHRLVSFYFRAWEKYRLPFAYERSKLDPHNQEADLATRGLYCFVGLGTGGLRNCLEIDDEAFLFYSGHFAHFPRSAIALECLLTDYFELTITVQQLQGQWLYLQEGDRARMPSPEFPKGLNNQVGVNLVAGDRVWDVQSKFRLRVGPLTYAQFARFMPNGDRLRPLCQLTRFYVGPELEFDVQLILQPAEVPWCQLGSTGAAAPCLGWNTWVRCDAFDHEVDDAVFCLEDV
jgi:type VI secretion system protein ImpH